MPHPSQSSRYDHPNDSARSTKHKAPCYVVFSTPLPRNTLILHCKILLSSYLTQTTMPQSVKRCVNKYSMFLLISIQTPKYALWANSVRRFWCEFINQSCYFVSNDWPSCLQRALSTRSDVQNSKVLGKAHKRAAAAKYSVCEEMRFQDEKCWQASQFIRRYADAGGGGSILFSSFVGAPKEVTNISTISSRNTSQHPAQPGWRQFDVPSTTVNTQKLKFRH